MYFNVSFRPYPGKGQGGGRGRKAVPGPEASLVWEEWHQMSR